MKTLIKTAIFFLALLGIIFFGASYFLKKIAEKTVAELKPRLEQKGIIVENFDYSNMRLNSYNSFAITNVDLKFHLNKKMYGKESFNARFNSQSISVRFADFDNPSFFFMFKGFSLYIEPEENSAKKPFGKLENGYLRSRIPFYLKDPEESAREILAELKTLFKENKTPVDVDITVDVLLGIDGKEVKTGLFTEREGDYTYLKFDHEDILQAAKQYDQDLTEKEAKIIASYPSKVPAMIKITRDAKRLSEIENGREKSFPEDAYKHIYWSYHLTREFGPALAKEITDAHETAPGNTKKERQMDYHNNEIGRKYADENISVNELRDRVLNSQEVIRFPNEVR